MRRYSNRFLSIASIWFGVALFDATRTVLSMRAEGMHHSWIRLFIDLFLNWLPWALATPYIGRLGRQFPLSQFRPSPAWLIHLSACAVIGLVCAVWDASLDLVLNPWLTATRPPLFSHLVLLYFNSGAVVFLILYAAILALSYMLESSRNLAIQQVATAQLNEQLSKAQLNALQRQIEPHFLFNALNAIAGLVREERNGAAVDMIAGLSEFLRDVLQDSSTQQVSLATEMNFVQKYLDIQKVRFAERLQLSVIVPDDLLPARVPRFTLQPIVENAFKHGISKRAQGGAIRIAADRSSQVLTLSVYNDGPKLASHPEKIAAGTGMDNLRTRLKSLYGDAFQLRMCDEEYGGVKVSVSIPFQAA